MCGICGITGTSERLLSIEKMTQAMFHRGPDDGGQYIEVDHKIALGHRRLSIIDLSSAGHQPMVSQCQRYTIVFNGEVYNYLEIRKKLEHFDISFVSETDTEVVLNAYIHWGEEAIHHFRGMFAFAIWDKKEEILFLARDRFGIKPLYYSALPESFVFASEMKALLSFPLLKRQINKKALADFLLFYAVPTPNTLVKNCYALEPGHYMVVKNHQIIRKQQYWHLKKSCPVNDPQQMSEDEIYGEVRRLLEESCNLRMRSDVPVGAFLSGGLDSSTTVGLMSRLSDISIKTFSIGFEQNNSDMNEWDIARQSAEFYGTEHHEVCVTGKDFHSYVEHYLEAMDHPSGDALNTYLVSKIASKHVKVSVSGLGGDELFAGYPFFKTWNHWQKSENSLLRSILAKGVEYLPGRVRNRFPFSELQRRADSSLESLYPHLRSHSSQNVLKEEWKENPSFSSFWSNESTSDFIQQLSLYETSGYMHHVLLRDNDAVSMAHSLELRVPMIDHELASFVWHVPSQYKIQRTPYNKPLLVKAVKDILPPTVVHQPKRGFDLPLKDWLKVHLKEELYTMVESSLFNSKATQQLLSVFFDTGDNAEEIWQLFVLDQWLRKYKLEF
jgi:asparagine synthase (glutamine-hydrolysing)